MHASRIRGTNAQSAAHTPREIFALDEFHDERLNAIGVFEP